MLGSSWSNSSIGCKLGPQLPKRFTACSGHFALLNIISIITQTPLNLHSSFSYRPKTIPAKALRTYLLLLLLLLHVSGFQLLPAAR